MYLKVTIYLSNYPIFATISIMLDAQLTLLMNNYFIFKMTPPPSYVITYENLTFREKIDLGHEDFHLINGRGYLNQYERKKNKT